MQARNQCTAQRLQASFGISGALLPADRFCCLSGAQLADRACHHIPGMLLQESFIAKTVSALACLASIVIFEPSQSLKT